MDTSATRIKLIVTIVGRGNGTTVVDFYRKNQLHYDFICYGLGTATSDILDYLGLESNEKDIVLSMAPAVKVPAVLNGLSHNFHLNKAGNGIAFAISLSAISARVPQILCKPEYLEGSEELVLEHENKFELILTVISHGNAEVVMDAAKEAGATGGTLLHGRRVGYEDVENVFGFTIQPEKDILIILTPKENKIPIMQKITEVAGMHTESRALVMSLPVDEIKGL